MPTIFTRTNPSGKTIYRAQVRVKGYPTESATFDRKTDAREWANRIEVDMKAGRYRVVFEAKRHTFGEMIDRYLRDVLPKKGRSSRTNQRTQLEWWKSALGTRLLSDVTPAAIVEARDALAARTTGRGRNPAPATVARYMTPLSHCFTVAVREWGWLEDSPMRNVSKPKEPPGRTRFLSNDERARLLDACRESHNPYLYPIVVLAISTGMRRGEILRLTWDRVDLRRGVITLLPEDTKNTTARAVPLHGPALEELRKLAEAKVRPMSAFVFPASEEKGVSTRPTDIRTAWEFALKRAEIENFRFHDLRHSAASYLAMNGATLAELADVLGHKTLQMVKRYAHLTEAHTSAVVERMNKAVFGGTTR